MVHIDNGRLPSPNVDATERTALLRPRTVSRATSTSIALPPTEPEESNQTRRISTVRGICIFAGYAILLFLSSANYTLMTGTVQGLVADDLYAYAEVSWFTSAYMIGASCLSPIFGRLSDIFSPRSCLLLGSAFFAIGNVVGSQSSTLAVFLLGRSLQGVGSASIVTISIISVIQLTTKKRRGLFIGMANACVTVGVSLGAVIGGALGETAGWRALILIQCPVVLTCATCVYLSLPARPHAQDPHGEKSISEKLWALDYSGVVLLVFCLASLSYGLSAPTIQSLPIIFGLVLAVIFVINEVYRAAVPIIPLPVLKSRGALLSCFGQLGFMSVRWSVLFYAPVFAQAIRLWPPAQAGAIIVPSNAGFATGGLLAGLLHIKRSGSFWLPTVICYTLFPITVLILSQISTQDSSIPGYIVMVFLNGAIVGAGLNYCLAHMLYLTLPETHFVVSSLLSTFRGISGSFGSAIGGGLFTRMLKANLEQGFADQGLVDKQELIRKLLGKPALVRQLTGLEQDISRLAYQDALRVLFLAGVVLACISIFVQAGTGWRAPDAEKNAPDAVQNED